MNIYKIDQVAARCGLTKRTIRYYEEIGLLFAPERSGGGYRLYSEKHIERLNQISNARDVLGISLQELQEFISINEEFNLQREDIRQVQDHEVKLRKLTDIEKTIGRQLRIIDQKLEKLTEIRAEISQLHERVVEAKMRIQPDQE
jgi:DNA-binding transcriptional MerR regulator